MTLKWQGSGAYCTYEVQRRLSLTDGSVEPWTTLAGQLTKPATDAGVPAGTAAVSYRVRALRGGKYSAWSNAGSLQLIADAGEATGLRIAA